MRTVFKIYLVIKEALIQNNNSSKYNNGYNDDKNKKRKKLKIRKIRMMVII